MRPFFISTFFQQIYCDNFSHCPLMLSLQKGAHLVGNVTYVSDFGISAPFQNLASTHESNNTEWYIWQTPIFRLGDAVKLVYKWRQFFLVFSNWHVLNVFSYFNLYSYLYQYLCWNFNTHLTGDFCPSLVCPGFGLCFQKQLVASHKSIVLLSFFSNVI